MPFVAVDPSAIKLDAPATPGFAPVDPATIKLDAPAGQNQGQGEALVQGFNSGIPFGEKATAGLGAAGAYAYDKATGLDAGSLGDYYNEARANQKATSAANPGTYLTGAVGGILSTLPAASSKAIIGATPTEGIRGAVNEVPAVLSSVGNWVRGGEAAKDAGTAAQAGNLALRMGRSAVVAAPVGAAYGAGSADPGKMSEGAESGAKVAAVLGAATPLVAAGWNALTRPAVSDSVKTLATRAQDLGIPLSADQVAPSNVRNTVQKISQNIPLSGVDAFQEGQRKIWLKEVAKTIGQDSPDLGPDTINKFLDDASSKFEAIVQHTDIKTNTKSLDALQNIVNDARGNITKDYSNIVESKANNIVNQLFKQREVPSGLEYTSKPLTGSKLASIRSQLVKSLPKVAGDARQYVGDMVDVIDNIAKDNLASADISKLDIARREWRNFRTIEPLLEKSTDGTINPTQLMQRVAANPYVKASRTPVGEDALVDLARIGKQFLPIKGGSDTAQKLAYLKGATELGTAAGALAAPFKVIPAVAANRAYQSFYNQSPGVVAKILSDNPQLPASAIPQLIEGNVASRLSK